MAKKTTKKKTGPKKKLATIRHGQKRANIPTEELRDFVSEDVQKQTKVLYPRNPDLDPQLVWRGKDEQDAADLEVPVVPIYIQEKFIPMRSSRTSSAPPPSPTTTIRSSTCFPISTACRRTSTSAWTSIGTKATGRTG